MQCYSEGNRGRIRGCRLRELFATKMHVCPQFWPSLFVRRMWWQSPENGLLVLARGVTQSLKFQTKEISMQKIK